jgi:hypothetical protein
MVGCYCLNMELLAGHNQLFIKVGSVI